MLGRDAPGNLPYVLHGYRRERQILRVSVHGQEKTLLASSRQSRRETMTGKEDKDSILWTCPAQRPIENLLYPLLGCLLIHQQQDLVRGKTKLLYRCYDTLCIVHSIVESWGFCITVDPDDNGPGGPVAY